MNRITGNPAAWRQSGFEREEGNCLGNYIAVLTIKSFNMVTKMNSSATSIPA